MDRERLREALDVLAGQNIYVGTSSWKYPGWTGQLYSEERYHYRGKFAKTRFERDCLAEYAEIFQTVCVDAGYYRFPTRAYVEKLVAQAPDGFRFSFKVTDEITVKHFSNLPRFGERAGQENPNFLNAALFCDAFLRAVEPSRDHIGLLMFEFSQFYPRDFERGLDFAAALDGFFDGLPKEGWQYGVEMRNRNFLHADYFEVLRRHGVAHVYNNWQRMPPISEQLTLEGNRTQPDFFGARFLLTPGRKYQDAVETFSPYNEVREVDDDARGAGAQLIGEGLRTKARQPSYLYVNNRLEGNALVTIEAMIRRADPDLLDQDPQG